MKHLRTQRFSTDNEFKYAIEERLKAQSELFTLLALKKLRVPYQMCLNKGGE